MGKKTDLIKTLQLNLLRYEGNFAPVTIKSFKKLRGDEARRVYFSHVNISSVINVSETLATDRFGVCWDKKFPVKGR